jgi:Pirin
MACHLCCLLLYIYILFCAADHPHRGFETVTYMLEGIFEHEDFTGTRGKVCVVYQSTNSSCSAVQLDAKHV